MSAEVAVTGKPAVRPTRFSVSCLLINRGSFVLSALTHQQSTETSSAQFLLRQLLSHRVVCSKKWMQIACYTHHLFFKNSAVLMCLKVCWPSFDVCSSSLESLVAATALSLVLVWSESVSRDQSASVPLLLPTLFINIDLFLSEWRVIFQTLLQVPLCSGCAAVILMPCTGTLKCCCPTSRPLSAENVSVQRWGRLCALNQATSRPLCR